ncbi:MAG: hypothetical protein Q7T89_08355 [Anaerolineales bacterium]|nr:hypothetical protein [Anaerolineales bacterium]
MDGLGKNNKTTNSGRTRKIRGRFEKSRKIFSFGVSRILDLELLDIHSLALFQAVEHGFEEFGEME